MKSNRLIVSGLILAALIFGGCRSAPPVAAPATNPSDDPAERPLPPPADALTYLNAALKDKSRLIEVYDDRGMDGALDDTGRSKLRSAVPKWWQQAQVISPVPKRGESPFRVTPDLGIRIYAPGTAGQQSGQTPTGRPDAEVMIFRARRVARVVIGDPSASRFSVAVYVLPTAEPLDWVNRLFAGKL